MHLHQYAFSWSLFLTDYPKCIGKPKPILSQMPLNDAWPQKRDFQCYAIDYFPVSPNLLVYRIRIQLSTCLLTLSHASGSSPSTLRLRLARPPPPPLFSELTSQKKVEKVPSPCPCGVLSFWQQHSLEEHETTYEWLGNPSILSPLYSEHTQP